MVEDDGVWAVLDRVGRQEDRRFGQHVHRAHQEESSVISAHAFEVQHLVGNISIPVIEHEGVAIQGSPLSTGVIQLYKLSGVQPRVVGVDLADDEAGVTADHRHQAETGHRGQTDHHDLQLLQKTCTGELQEKKRQPVGFLKKIKEDQPSGYISISVQEMFPDKTVFTIKKIFEVSL